MTNGRNHQVEEMDIAILGGGPAGLQAALVLSRTRKKIIVFDDPEPPEMQLLLEFIIFLA
jgi:flavin-dependent dehydrogenase